MEPDSNRAVPEKSYVPRLVFWELTKGCNLRCVHCRASAQELASPLDLDTVDSLKVIDKISAYARPVLVLSGGEPLFRKDLFALAAYATERGLPVALASNGTLITPEVAYRLRACGIRRVAISFDGADAETHDRFRGQPGAFEAALRGLLAASPPRSTPPSPAAPPRSSRASCRWRSRSASTLSTPSCSSPSAAAPSSPKTKWCPPTNTKRF
jgi:MoaA/NifB/PqqE/SkfB family radical SAM enzyme